MVTQAIGFWSFGFLGFSHVGDLGSVPGSSFSLTVGGFQGTDQWMRDLSLCLFLSLSLSPFK